MSIEEKEKKYEQAWVSVTIEVFFEDNGEDAKDQQAREAALRKMGLMEYETEDIEVNLADSEEE